MTRDEETGTGKGNTRVLLLAGMLLGVAAAALWANLWKDDLRIAGITIDGNRILSSGEIIARAGIDRNEKLYTVDLFAVRRRIEENSFVQSASVNRDALGRIRISVVERVPIAAIVLDGLLYLDAAGCVLPPSRSRQIFDLPIITGVQGRTGLSPGKQVSDPDLHEALQILSVARQLDDGLYRGISEIRLGRGEDIILYTSEAGVPVIFGHGDAPAKLLKFDAFWKKFVVHRGPAELQSVDLRFEDQVVVRWTARKEDAQLSSNVLHHKEESWTTSL